MKNQEKWGKVRELKILVTTCVIRELAYFSMVYKTQPKPLVQTGSHEVRSPPSPQLLQSLLALSNFEKPAGLILQLISLYIHKLFCDNIVTEICTEWHCLAQIDTDKIFCNYERMWVLSFISIT
jgi:hypothetical protein